MVNRSQFVFHFDANQTKQSRKGLVTFSSDKNIEITDVRIVVDEVHFRGDLEVALKPGSSESQDQSLLMSNPIVQRSSTFIARMKAIVGPECSKISMGSKLRVDLERTHVRGNSFTLIIDYNF